MFLSIIFWVLVALWSIANLHTAVTMNADEMYREYIKGQCVVGRVCANAFYSLAWVLKGAKALIK